MSPGSLEILNFAVDANQPLHFIAGLKPKWALLGVCQWLHGG